MRRPASGRPVSVALVPWGTPLEVFLDPLGKTLDDFCERLSGGWLFGYAEALQLAGHQPELVLCSRTVDKVTSRTHTPTGTPVTVVPAPTAATTGPPGLRSDLSAYRRALPPALLGVLSRHDVVLVQEYEEPRSDLLAWWGRLRGVHVVATFQGGVPAWTSAPVQRRVRRPSVRRLAGVLVGSGEEAGRVVASYGVDRSRVHRVVNPVDVAAWSPRDRLSARSRLRVPAAAFVVAWHGRVDLRRKGLDVLLEAWADLCARRPNTDLRLLMVGAGPDEAAVRSQLSDPCLRGVQWHAQYAAPEQVRERLAACDVWVSASRHEGFAVAPLEAMASGRAVVLSDAPGAADLLGATGEWGGRLVARGSAPALTAALLDALDDAPRLDDRGRAGRRRVQDAFSVQAVSRQLDTALVAAVPRGSP